MLQTHRLELCWTDKKSKFSPNVRKKHGFQADYDRKSIRKLGEFFHLSKKNITALELKNFNDEINNFFMKGYCSKTWNYVKLKIKVSMKWKN